MKFTNTHLVGVVPVAGAAPDEDVVVCVDLALTWTETHYAANTGHDYYDLKIWPLNEHIDDIADDPDAEGPVCHNDGTFDTECLDQDDTVYWFSFTSAWTYGDYDDCEDKSYGGVYDLDTDKGDWFD